MKWTEYHEIIGALEQAQKKEREYCQRYCELNPDDKKHREQNMHDRMYGLFEAMHVINHLIQTGKIRMTDEP